MVNDVIDGVKYAFLDDSIDDQVLQELRQVCNILYLVYCPNSFLVFQCLDSGVLNLISFYFDFFICEYL